jgi:hypothetical protein
MLSHGVLKLMNKFLPTIINTLSKNTQSTISSLISEMRQGKQDIPGLVSRLNSFRIDTGFSTTTIKPFDKLDKQILVDIFKDIDLRVKSHYASANTVNLLINSMIDIFSSEIEKVEKDIKTLETFIDNYEYISGKDDLFNSNYVEKFDNFMNDYRSDGYNFDLFDRDGNLFSSDGNGFIDTKLGLFKIGNNILRKNYINLVEDYSITTNYDLYKTTDTGFESVYNDVYTDSWSVTVKSPFILTSKLSQYSKYIPYDTSYITGAQTAIEIELAYPINMDSIIITPNSGENLQLMQLVLVSDLDQTNYDYEVNPIFEPNDSDISLGEKYYGVLSQPRIINSNTEITFTKTLVSKIIIILNQQTYTRTKNSPIKSEVNGIGLYNTAKIIKTIKNRNTDKIQNLAYNVFLNNNNYKKITRNSYNKIDDYYTYRHPCIDENFSSLNHHNNYLYENFSMDSTSSLPNNMISDLFRNLFSTAIGDRGEIFENPVYINSDSNINSSFNFNKMGFLITQNINNMPNQISGNKPLKYKWKNDLLKTLLNTGDVDGYNYSFSIKSIDLCEIIPSENVKACFVSRKIPFNGYPMAIKCRLAKNANEFNIVNKDLTLKNPVSYELSISNEDVIRSEQNWIPICESGVNVIDSEVLFFDEQSFSAKTRFPLRQDTFKLYKNGILLNANAYNILLSGDIILQNVVKNSIYTCSYSIDLSLYDVDNVDFLRLGLLNESLKSANDGSSLGELFNGTDSSGRIKLNNIPYVNTNSLDTAIYSELIGTIFQGNQNGYSPIKVLMPDGSYAINLTNYTGSNIFPQFRSSNSLYYFIQNGRNIIFNKPVIGDVIVSYDYLADTIRFRLIIRKNIPNTTYSGSVDAVLLKAKTKNYDPYYDKLTKVISNS